MPTNTQLTYKEGKSVANLHGSQFKVNRIIRLALQLLTEQIMYSKDRVTQAQADVERHKNDSFIQRTRWERQATIENATLQRLQAERAEYRALIGITIPKEGE